MLDNFGLFDEFVSGGVYFDGYNSSIFLLLGFWGVNLFVIIIVVYDEEIWVCMLLLRDFDGYLVLLCILLFIQSELVLFDLSDGFKVLVRILILECFQFLDFVGGWYM